MADPVEVMARAMGASKTWPVVFEAGSATVLSRAALSALDAAGFAVVPKEPTPEMRVAGLFAWADACGAMPQHRPDRDGEEVERQRLMHIGAVSVSTAQLVPAYRAMLSAAQVKP